VRGRLAKSTMSSGDAGWILKAMLQAIPTIMKDEFQLVFRDINLENILQFYPQSQSEGFYSQYAYNHHYSGTGGQSIVKLT
jgi:hypothetical protein